MILLIQSILQYGENSRWLTPLWRLWELRVVHTPLLPYIQRASYSQACSVHYSLKVNLQDQRTDLNLWCCTHSSCRSGGGAVVSQFESQWFHSPLPLSTGRNVFGQFTEPRVASSASLVCECLWKNTVEPVTLYADAELCTFFFFFSRKAGAWESFWWTLGCSHGVSSGH